MRPNLVAILLLAASAAAQGTISEDGALAPPNRWTVRGGCAARTAATEARAPRLAPEVAWTYRAAGEIEGEPLVWDDLVVLTTRQGAGRRVVHVVDRATGRKRCQQTLPAAMPLAAAIWDGRLAVRPQPDRVDLYRLAGSRLLPLRSIKSSAPLSEPLLFAGALYVREGHELVRYDFGRRDPVWRARVAGSFRGTPSLRGDRVYAVWYDGRGVAHLAGIDRDDGEVRDDALVGSHGGAVPDALAPLDVIVLERDVFLRFPLPVEGPAGTSFFVSRVYRTDDGLDETGRASLHAFPLDPAQVGDGWAALEERTAATRKWVVARVDGETMRGIVLADEDIHPELLVDPRPLTAAGTDLYLQGLAVDVEDDYEVRWRVPEYDGGRVVPIERGLLVVSGPEELTALVAPAPTWSPGAARADAARAEMEARIAAGYASLVPKALRAKDAELAERFLATAYAGGATGRTLDIARESVAALLAQDPPPAPNPRLRRALEDEERTMIADQRAALLRRATTSGDGEFRRRLLRDLLELDSAAPAVVAAVRDLVPADAPRGPVFDPVSWLDFLDALGDAPVDHVLPPTDDSPAPTAEQQALAREAKEWRADVAGHGSQSLFVVSPPGRPGAIGHALRTGELVCDILEGLFAPTDPERARERLQLFLYETHEEYVAQSQRRGSRPEVARGWTAGHFDPTDGISRLFVPADDERYARLLRVHAHELTHHWLSTRSPFAGAMGTRELRGYWVTEGIAVLIEEFVLDPAAGTWDPHNPRAPSLDLVANARPADLLPWDRLFALSRAELTTLSTDRDRAIPRTWQLGARHERNEIEVFYAQAGAACHYLFEAEGGLHRAALLEYVRAWYEREEDALDPTDAFGLTARELGERIVAFARETVERE